MIANVAVRRTRDPFQDPSPADALDPAQGVAVERNAPLDRPADVSAENGSLQAGDRIRHPRERQSAKGGPEQRRRRNEISSGVPAWEAQVIPHEGRGSAALPSRQEEVEPCAVRWSETDRPFAAGNQVGAIEFPTEDDPAVMIPNRRRRKPGRGRHAAQRGQPGNAPGKQTEGENAREATTRPTAAAHGTRRATPRDAPRRRARRGRSVPTRGGRRCRHSGSDSRR